MSGRMSGIRLRLFVSAWAVVAGSVYACGLALAPNAPPAGGYRALCAVVGGALAALVISTLAVRWFDLIVRPVTDAARRMQDGDLSVRARVARAEDVGELGAAFDELAGSFSR